MEIFIYRTYNEWFDDKPTETLEGEVNSIYNGVLVIDTLEEFKRYRQILSLKNNFAIVYKLSYGFYHMLKKSIFIQILILGKTLIRKLPLWGKYVKVNPQIVT